jgi:hypothetical protein
MGGNAFANLFVSSFPWSAGIIIGSLMLARSALSLLGKVADKLPDLVLRIWAMNKLSSNALTDDQARIILGTPESVEAQTNSDAGPKELKNKPAERSRRHSGKRRKRKKRG